MDALLIIIFSRYIYYKICDLLGELYAAIPVVMKKLRTKSELVASFCS